MLRGKCIGFLGFKKSLLTLKDWLQIHVEVLQREKAVDVCVIKGCKTGLWYHLTDNLKRSFSYSGTSIGNDFLVELLTRESLGICIFNKGINKLFSATDFHPANM